MPDFADGLTGEEPLEEAQQVAEEATPAPPIRSLSNDGPADFGGAGQNAFNQLNRSIQTGFRKIEDMISGDKEPAPESPVDRNVFNYAYNNNSYTTINNRLGQMGERAPDAAPMGQAESGSPDFASARPTEQVAAPPDGKFPSSAPGATFVTQETSEAPTSDLGIHGIEGGPESTPVNLRDFAAGAAPTGSNPPQFGSFSGRATSPAPAPSSDAMGVAPVADQRARDAFTSGEAPEAEADATRMARILEIDSQIERGAAPASDQIQAWASAIREGRQREIADLDPAKVQQAVEQAMGGGQGAQAANTPEVAQLEVEHQARTQTLQAGLEARETVRARRDTAQDALATRANASATTQTPEQAQPAVASITSATRTETAAAPGVTAQERAATRDFAVEGQSPQSDMTGMLRYNDAAHEMAAVAGIESDTSKRNDEDMKVSGSPVREIGSPVNASAMSAGGSPRIGSVQSPMSGLRAKDESAAVKPKKGPWGEGRELREVADLLRDILNEVRRG